MDCMIKPQSMSSSRPDLLLTCLLTLSLALGHVTGQEADARAVQARESVMTSTQAREMRSEPGVSLAPIASPEAQKEFGEQVVIRREASFDPWKVELDVQGFHTDNVALAPRRVEDFFLRTGLEVSYTNRLGGGWNAEFLLGQDALRYDQFSSLNFDRSRAAMGLSTKLSWLGGATLLARYQFDHLMEEGFGSSIMTTHSILAGVIKSWRVGDKQRFHLGYLSEPDLYVDPDIAVRHEHGLHAGYSLKLTERLTARLTGRAAYYSSPNAGREDWNFLARFTATYALTDWANVSASIGMTWNHSTKDRFDYRVQLTGAYLGLELRF